MDTEDAEAQDRHAEEIVIVEGVFSWFAAWMMMLWLVVTICSITMAIMTFQGDGIERISEEISFVRQQSPPYGPAEQPALANTREINEPFRYHLPQVALFYSAAAAALGLFTVSFFANSMLLETQGTSRAVDINMLIAEGVQTYMSRTFPVIILFLVSAGGYVYVTSGWGTLTCFGAGAFLNLISAWLGVRAGVQGTCRLATVMGENLKRAVQLGMYTGAIGGLLSTSLALGGMAAMWFWSLDTSLLSGFGSGACLVSFYLRVGGGIFSKGAELGGDLVGEMSESKVDEERRVFELQQRMESINRTRKERVQKGLEDDEEEALDQLRMLEEEMHDMCSDLHPIDFLDEVGEVICDLTGTCVDLFESMVLILSTSAIIGAKTSAVPHFLTGLPFWIVASGNIGCSLAACKIHCTERYSARALRWSLRLSLLAVIFFVQFVQVAVSYLEWVHGSITFTMFWHFVLISMAGQLLPEFCVMTGEYFTSPDYYPIRNLAANSKNGVVQVVLQGLGQGFLSTATPAILLVLAVMVTWGLEGHYGLALLASSSVSGTGFQGSIASFGAISTNAHKQVHLTTYDSLSRNRANTLAMLGDIAMQAGNTISAINAFSAVFGVALALLAQTYTARNLDYQAVSGSPLSEWSQAGLVLGVIMPFLFTGNTTVSCLETSKSFMRFCKESETVSKISNLPFPHSHIKGLRILSSFGTVTSMRLVFSPIIHSMICPLLGGFFLGTRGLIWLLSGMNVIGVCLSLFLINSGQSWVSARKYVLFGNLKDADGDAIGPDSPQYGFLGVGEMIGGPLEDVSGPALNNFVKLVAVFAFITGGLYEEEPTSTWPFGLICLVASFLFLAIARCILSCILDCLTKYMEKRERQKLEKQRVREAKEAERKRLEEAEAEEDNEEQPMKN